MSFNKRLALLKSLHNAVNTLNVTQAYSMSQEVIEEGLSVCLSVCQGEMSRAQMVILHGHQMAANHHYALALIVQRCNELRHHCDVITNAIRTKRASLTRARGLLLRLEAVTEFFFFCSCCFWGRVLTDCCTSVECCCFIIIFFIFERLWMHILCMKGVIQIQIDWLIDWLIRKNVIAKQTIIQSCVQTKRNIHICNKATNPWAESTGFSYKCISCLCVISGSSLVWWGRLSPGQSNGGPVPDQGGRSGGLAAPGLSPGEGAVGPEEQPGHPEPGVRSYPHTTAAGTATEAFATRRVRVWTDASPTAVCLQSQIFMVTEKLSSMQSMIRNREQCLRKLADVQVRPVQLVAPRPEADLTSQRCKSPLFSPKHGTTLWPLSVTSGWPALDLGSDTHSDEFNAKILLSSVFQ